MKPKVLIIIDTYYVGGAGKVILQFLDNADHSRFDYVLSTFLYRTPPSTEFIDTAAKKGFNLKLFSQRFRFDISPLWEIMLFIRKENINIVESHGYKGHLLAWVCACCFRIGWIGVAHGWTSENWKVKQYNRLERWLLKKADWVISVSPDIVNLLKAIRGPGKRTSLILNAVDETVISGEAQASEIRARCQLTSDTFLIGVFGRLSPEKGHAFLLRAISSELNAKDIVIVIVGTGPEEQSLLQIVKDKDLETRVLFEGQKKNMRDYYEAVDLLVLPSLSEGLPLVVLESMAMGTPVLATDVGAIPKVISDGENGWLVEPGVEKSFREKLLLVLEDRENLAEIGEKAKNSLFPKFHPERQCDEVTSVYQEVCRRSE